MNLLGENLKKLRKSKGASQKEVSNYLGVTPTAYGYYESGKRCPTLEILKSLALFFDVSIDSLVGMKAKTKEMEVTKLCEDLNLILLNCDGLLLNGAPISKESLQILTTSIKIGLGITIENELKSKI